MPRGSILTLNDDSYASDVVKHCVRPVDMIGRSGVLLFRKIRENLLQEALDIEMEDMTSRAERWELGMNIKSAVRSCLDDLLTKVESTLMTEERVESTLMNGLDSTPKKVFPVHTLSVMEIDSNSTKVDSNPSGIDSCPCELQSTLDTASGTVDSTSTEMVMKAETQGTSDSEVSSTSNSSSLPLDIGLATTTRVEDDSGITVNSEVAQASAIVEEDRDVRDVEVAKEEMLVSTVHVLSFQM